jgi:hypothetical protein
VTIVRIDQTRAHHIRRLNHGYTLAVRPEGSGDLAGFNHSGHRRSAWPTSPPRAGHVHSSASLTRAIGRVDLYSDATFSQLNGLSRSISSDPCAPKSQESEGLAYDPQRHRLASPACCLHRPDSGVPGRALLGPTRASCRRTARMRLRACLVPSATACGVDISGRWWLARSACGSRRCTDSRRVGARRLIGASGSHREVEPGYTGPV